MSKKNAEYRAEQVKTLAEQRGALLTEMDGIIGKAKAEVRAMTDEENTRISEIEKEVGKLSATIEAERRAEKLKADINRSNAEASNSAEQRAEGAPSDTPDKNDVTEEEKRAVMNYIYRECKLPAKEIRAGEQNINMGNNGGILPVSIANRIIDKVVEICPIMRDADRYSVKGTLKIPVYGLANGTHDVSVGYQDEFTELTADAGKFDTVDLTGYLAGGLTLIGRSVIANSDTDVLNFIINKMAQKVAIFAEHEGLVGTSGKAVGALDTTNYITSNAAAAVTADELIELQSKVPANYQKNACWTMHPDTFVSIKKLKDASGQYLLMQNLSNISNGFPYMLLGKPVYLSDNMPTMAAGSKAVLYGDYSGLGVNMRQEMEIQVLYEKYATQHAIGIVTWLEFDCDIVDHQKLAVLKMKTT